VKSILFTFFLLIPLMTPAQKDQRVKDSLALFGPTPIGTPDGELTIKKIGRDGGKLVSSDKKLELIIPAGALLSETEINIQPSTNFATAGVGKAYSLEPHGIQFEEPVQLVFHYTDKEMNGDSPQLMAISTQSEKGNWLRLKNIKLDTLNKTIIGSTRHFSFYAMTWKIVFRPRSTKVKVNKQVEIELYVAPVSEETDISEQADATAGVFDYQYQNPRNWSVNSVPNGDENVGTIIKSPIREVTSAIYKAPDKIPDQNPVAIQVEIVGVEILNWFETITKKCEVLVFDDLYEVNMIATMKGGDKRSWGGKKTYSDEGSFIVSLDTKTPTIKDIKNNLEVMTDNCKKIILNKGTNTGMIHITGVQRITVSPSESPAGWERLVEIAFVMRPVELTKVQYSCPPPPGYIPGNATGNTVGPMALLQSVPAMPVYIKFIAKEGEQVIEERGKPGDELYYKIWVRQVKQDE
jgi:hypothetical protein